MNTVRKDQYPLWNHLQLEIYTLSQVKHAHLYTHTYKYAHTYPRHLQTFYINTHANVHTWSQLLVYTQALKMNTHNLKHACIRTHTHTHTHTCTESSYGSSYIKWDQARYNSIYMKTFIRVCTKNIQNI